LGPGQGPTMSESDLASVEAELLGAVAAAGDEAGLDAVRVGALGKKGSISERMKALGGMPIRRSASRRRRPQHAARRGEPGPAASAARRWRTASSRRAWPPSASTSPAGAPEPTGSIHPISQTIEEVVAIFGEMGFRRRRGAGHRGRLVQLHRPQHPAEHPARQEMDTFYLPGTRDGAAWCCAPTPRRCRSAPCRRRRRRSGSSRPAAPTAAIPMPPTRRCSIRSRGWWSTRPCTWATSRAASSSSAAPSSGRRPAGALPAQLLPLHRAVAEVDIGCTRAGGTLSIGTATTGWRSSAAAWCIPKVLENCGIDPDPLPGLRLRHGHRAHRHAQIRHPGPADLLRVRPALAAALRLPRPGGAVAGRGPES
jgi:phenylalanyl-tRNA synthetase alpha chain